MSYSKLRLGKDEPEPALCPYCPLELELLRINPRYLDKPTDFELGFVGLTAFSGFEVITDFDYYHYDESWNMTSTKQVRLEKQAHDEQNRLLQNKKHENQQTKSKGSMSLESLN